MNTREYIYSIIEKAEDANRWSRAYDIVMLLTIVDSVLPLVVWGDYPVA